MASSREIDIRLKALILNLGITIVHLRTAVTLLINEVEWKDPTKLEMAKKGISETLQSMDLFLKNLKDLDMGLSDDK